MYQTPANNGVNYLSTGGRYLFHQQHQGCQNCKTARHQESFFFTPIFFHALVVIFWIYFSSFKHPRFLMRSHHFTMIPPETISQPAVHPCTKQRTAIVLQSRFVKMAMNEWHCCAAPPGENSETSKTSAENCGKKSTHIHVEW